MTADVFEAVAAVRLAMKGQQARHYASVLSDSVRTFAAHHDHASDAAQASRERRRLPRSGRVGEEAIAALRQRELIHHDITHDTGATRLESIETFKALSCL